MKAGSILSFTALHGAVSDTVLVLDTWSTNASSINTKAKKVDKIQTHFTTYIFLILNINDYKILAHPFLL